MTDLDKEIMISQRELKDVMAACYDRIIRLEKRVELDYRRAVDALNRMTDGEIDRAMRKANGSS